ncbi:MAG: LpxA family transferase [Flavobacteriaceae bacterium]|nr:LpxA family transferase [Flavobacteriaceae bacterium]
MLPIEQFIRQFSTIFTLQQNLLPWELINNLSEIINDLSAKLGEDYYFKDGIVHWWGGWVHKTAVIEQGAVLKGPVIVSQNCHICCQRLSQRPGLSWHDSVKDRPGSRDQTKHLIFANSATAHFNSIGNSIIGADVNFEAGSICANHYNERQNKSI